MNENTKNKIKVDTAVILACGLGTRLAPLTFDTPKCMLKAKGEVLIERQIEQMKKKGIEEIIVAVGYLKEKFEYLKNKYNVKLVYNEEYNKKNTLSTLHKVMPHLKDKSFYISVADIYLDENVFNEYEMYSHFKSVYIKGAHDEWWVELDKDDRIIKINRHSDVSSYTMVGIAFFSKEDGKVLSKYCDELYNKEGTESFYWEEILYTYLNEFKNFYQVKLKKNIFHEFDTFDELKAFNDNSCENKYNDYGSKTLSIVAKAINVKESEIEDIEVGKYGLTNKSFVFTIKNENPNKKYLVRVPGVGTNEYIIRKDEKIILNELKKYDVTENIIYYDDEGYKISEYFNNARQLNIDNEEELKNAIHLLKKIHSYNIKITNVNDIEDSIDKYLEVARHHNIKIPDDIKTTEYKIRELIKFKKSLNRPHRFCHGDFNPTNVLFTEKGIRIIDFEYSIMSDPLTDISCFGGYCGLSIEKILELYDIYYKAEGDNSIYNGISEKDLKKLYLTYIAMCSFYDCIWGIINEYLSNTNVTDYIKNNRELLMSSLKKLGD